MPSPKTQTFAPDSLLTSYQVGTLLQVNPSSVNKWIQDGRIPAYRTPGGHRRIRAQDLMAFLTEHKMPIPKGLIAHNHKVLAISDDPQLFDDLRHYSPNKTAIAFTFAQDGIDGLMQVGTLSPELVLLGPSVRPLDCLDVCRRIRASDQTKRARVVVIVEADAPDLEQRAKTAGASHVLRTPVLGSAIEALLTANG